MCDFLNTLDNNLPCLLKTHAMNIIDSDPIGGVNMVLLHDNEYAILNRIAFLIVKKHNSHSQINCREYFFDNTTPDNGSYIASEYHFEFELSEQSLNYIRNIIKNKPIINNEFIFVIKNASQNVNRNLYLELRRLIDTSNISRWIMTMERATFLDKSLQSRALMINCNFPLENVLKCCQLPLEVDKYSHIFMKARGNVVNFIQLISTSNTSLLWQDSFDTFMTNVLKEKKQVNVINASREMAYKLFHVGIPLAEFCRYIVFKHGESIVDIIPTIAQCDHVCSKHNECLLYEKVILEVYKQLQIASLCKSKSVKSTKTSTKARKNI